MTLKVQKVSRYDLRLATLRSGEAWAAGQLSTPRDSYHIDLTHEGGREQKATKNRDQLLIAQLADSHTANG